MQANIIGAVILSLSIGVWSCAHAESCVYGDSMEPVVIYTKAMKEHRFADAAEGLRQEELRHHDALEKIGGLTDDDRVDVGPSHFRVRECANGGLANQPHLGDVDSLGVVFCLSDSNDGGKDDE